MTTRFEFALYDFLHYCLVYEDDGSYSKFFRDYNFNYDYDYGGHEGRSALGRMFNAN